MSAPTTGRSSAVTSAPGGPTEPQLEVAPSDDGLTLVDRSPLEVDEDALVDGIEAILFVADEPVTLGAISEALVLPVERVRAAIDRLAAARAAAPGGVELREVAGGWRLYTAPSARAVLERWVLSGRTGRLTQAALETLAVVAYKQPISRQEIGDVRGVNPDTAVRSLVARGYIEEVGRDPGPGQAVLYGTTSTFLERLGISSLEELPSLAEFLADAPAPDEPAPDTLREVRRRLKAGGELDTPTPTAGVAGVADDDEDDDLLPAPSGSRPLTEDGIDELTGRLDRAARSAASRLRTVIAATRPPEEATAAEAAAEEGGTDGVDADG
jgi:segregation and condensation protein B